MVKLNKPLMWGIGITILILLAFAFNIGGLQFAIIGQQDQWYIYDQSCSLDSECRDYFLSEGATEEILENTPYRCEEKKCQLKFKDTTAFGVVPK